MSIIALTKSFSPFVANASADALLASAAAFFFCASILDCSNSVMPLTALACLLSASWTLVEPDATPDNCPNPVISAGMTLFNSRIDSLNCLIVSGSKFSAMFFTH